MNLAQSVNVAVPEISIRRQRKGFPRLHPKILVREHTTGDMTSVVVSVPRSGNYYTFPPEQWALIKLFDGERSYAEIAELYQAETGAAYSEDVIRSFAQNLEESGFWYKSPQEQSLSFLEKTAAERQKQLRRKSHATDLAQIELLSWDPNKFLTYLYDRLSFVFSGWFILLSLGLFGFMAYIFVDRWSEISGDTLRFFNFTQKGFADLLLFWGLIFVMAGIHESAHGLGCKYCGGNANKMGLLLIYLTPAFFCEIVEAYVYGGRSQRITAVLAGMWSEMLVCSVATIVWWGTPPDTFAHEFSYMFVLVAGIAGVVNFNPLIKTDGYYIFTELIGIADLKEAATNFTSTWTRKNLLRLPVEVEYVSKKRRPFYAAYALLSGLYSYTLLLVIVRFSYNILHSYTPEWAFLPAIALGLTVFKSRIRNLGRLMKTVYLDKKERLQLLYKRPLYVAAACLSFLLLVLPLRHESVEAQFVIEPSHRVWLRTEVGGVVSEILAGEGQRVTAGTPMVRLANLDLQSSSARATADLSNASARATQAELRFRGYGPVERERQQLAVEARLLREQEKMSTLVSDVSGTVMTPRLADLVGSYAEPGTTLAEVADLSTLAARIYVPEAYLPKIHVGASAVLHPSTEWGGIAGKIQSIAPDPQAMEGGVTAKTSYEGTRSASFYVATVLIENPSGMLKVGSTGTAKIFGERRSLVGSAVKIAREFLQRKIW